MVRPWYVTRERLKAALDIPETARMNPLLDEACEVGTDAVDRLCRRTFHPWTGTRYFDWPACPGPSWTLRLGTQLGEPARPDLISASSVTAAGTAIAATDYFTRPDDGPPYTRLEIDLASSADFDAGDTHQQAIAVTGVWGFRNDTAAAGALAAAMADTTSTTATVTDASLVGVGDLLVVDSERLIVTGRAQVTTGQTISDALTAADDDVTTAVADATAVHVGEEVLIDSEKVRIDEISGTTLTITRGVDGTALAAHNVGATVYAPRALTVVRGAQGTTAATHLITAAVTRHQAPALVRQLARAEAIHHLKSDQGGWARTVGQGEGQREMSGRGIAQLRADVAAAYRRRILHRGI